jgi:hypothetical protein
MDGLPFASHLLTLFHHSFITNTKTRALDLHANYKLMKLDMQTKSTTPLRRWNYVSITD